jgi:competence protein ComEA
MESGVELLARKPRDAAPPSPAPSPIPGRSSTKIQPGEPPIDLNRASEAELTRLPGIGAVLAAKIVQDRGEGFKTIDELRRVRGIGAKTLEAVRPFVVVR